MRSFLLILATLIVLGAAAAIYTWMQPPAAGKSAHEISASNRRRPQLDRTIRGIGEGQSPWIKHVDSKTGEITSQMRAEVWDPQKDNSVNVIKPQAEFFSSDGRQRIRIDGTDGNILMPPTPENKTAKLQNTGPVAMPSRGKLHDVVVSIFEPIDATEPTLVARMNNAAFDTDLFRIATEAFKDKDGKTIEADRVPVTLRGRDYDFDGEGLVIRWNERDRKLQLLEVAHGKSLVIKNPSALGHSDLLPATQPAARGLAPSPLPGMLASSDRHAPGLILTAAKPKKPLSKSAAARRRHPTSVPTTAPVPTTKKSIRDLSPVVYCATFDRDVKIYQTDSPTPDVPSATGDVMKVYFLQVPDRSALATQPSAQTTSTQAARPSTQPATHSVRLRATTRRTDAAAPLQPEAQPTSTQQSAPVIVKWKGKLRVVPVDSAPDAALQPGKAIVHLIGTPATLDQRGMNAECGEAIFNAATDSARLLPLSTTQPIVMRSAEGWVVHTEKRVDYDESPDGPRVATLVGRSNAKIPVDGDDPNSHASMNAKWSRQCKLRMVDVNGRTAMQQVDLLGNVVVDHPKLLLTSDNLALKFDPNAAPTTRRSTTSPSATQATRQASTQPTSHSTLLASSRPSTTNPTAVTAALREILATGNSDCHIKDPDDPREIQSRSLDVFLAQDAENQMYTKTVIADGNFKTSDKSGSMTGGHLIAHMLPSTKPTINPSTHPTSLAVSQTSTADPVGTTFPASKPTTRHATMQNFGGNVRLESMTATDNVVLTSTDGTIAHADELHAETIDNQLRYTLIGTPNATITSTKGNNGKTTIAGPTISFNPQENIARVIGGGSGEGFNPDKPGQKMNMTWTGDATVDGNTNLIDVDQQVHVVSRDSDGTVNTADAKHLQAVLTSKPSTQPSTEPSTHPTTLASARKSKSASSDETSSFMKDKEITAGTLTGDVHVTSVLLNDDSSLAREFDLWSEKVVYDQLAGNLVIPVPGRLLYQDHRSTTRPTTGPTTRPHHKAATRATTTRRSGEGNTGVWWTKSLVYGRANRTVTLTENVHVIHKPDSDSEQPFDLKSDVLTATFEPRPTTQSTTKPGVLTSSRPTTKPTTMPTGEDDLGQLRLLTATGNVRITATRLSIEAPQVSFDPVHQILTAIGDPNNAVNIFDTATGPTDQVARLIWNIQTDEMHVEKMVGRLQRR